MITGAAAAEAIKREARSQRGAHELAYCNQRGARPLPGIHP